MMTVRFRCALIREVGRSRYAKGELKDAGYRFRVPVMTRLGMEQ